MQEAISGCKYLEGIEPMPTNQQLLSQIAYENLAKSQCYAIFRDVLMGRDAPLADLPCVLGRSRGAEAQHLNIMIKVKDGSKHQGKHTVVGDEKFVSGVGYYNDVDMEELLKSKADTPLIAREPTTTETITSVPHVGLCKCRALAFNALMLRYNTELQRFEIMALDPNSEVQLNQQVLRPGDAREKASWMPLNHMDDLRLYCDRSCGQ